MKTDKKLTGTAGEHYVCAALARRGWAPALTRDGLKRVDILAINTETQAMVSIQVKTTMADNFTLGNVPLAQADNEWYVLVRIGTTPNAPVECFVVPRDHVAAASWIGHHLWLTDPEVPVGKRNTPVSGSRVKSWVFDGYKERWDLLGSRTDDAPVLLPPQHREFSQLDRVGLPAGHPWRETLPQW